MPKTHFPEEFDTQITKDIRIGWRQQTKGKFWYGRFYWKHTGNHAYYSLKIPYEPTRLSFKKAEEAARAIWPNFAKNIEGGGHYARDNSVAAVSYRYLREMKKKAIENDALVEKGRLPKWQDNRNGYWNKEKFDRRSKRHERIEEFLGNDWKKHISNIDLRGLNRFKDWAKEKKDWSPSTINYHITELRQIFAYAFNNSLVDNVPTIAREPQNLHKRRRRALKESEWDLMINWAADRFKKRRDIKIYTDDDVDKAYQYWLWLHVIGYTGIRPPSGRVKKNLLLWDNYEVQNEGTPDETRTFWRIEEKDHTYEAAIMPECWDIFDLLEEHRIANGLDKTFLFQHTHDKKGSYKKGDPILSFKTSWQTMLRETGLKMPKGTPAQQCLVPYALRGYYITMRLRYGDVRVVDLAKACGTSAKMIEEIYYEFITRKKYGSLTSGSVPERTLTRKRIGNYAEI